MMVKTSTAPNTAIPRVALLSGVTGFIGGHLARRLIQDGWRVTTLVRDSAAVSGVPDGCEVRHYDGTTAGLVRIVTEAKPEVVFHLASRFLARHTTEDIDSLAESNLRFGLQLLEATVISGCLRFINTGTGWQHFENSDYNPVCLYAATKQAFESLIDYYVRVHHLKAATLKLHDTYGPGDTRGKLIALLVEAARTGYSLDLSPGEQRIDLVHVHDVVEAFIGTDRFLLNEPAAVHHRFMVTSGDPLSIRELAQAITSVTGRVIHANWGGRPYREREVMDPWSKGSVVLGWSPMCSLEQGIREIWESKGKNG